MTIVILAGSFLASPAMAGGHANKAGKKLGHGEKGPKHLQLESFMAPVLYLASQRTGSEPVTLILNIPDQGKVGSICRITPRIRDAIMVSLFDKPIPVKRGKAELAGTSTQLLEAINKALGSDMVSKVIIMTGARSMGRGATRNLPFSSYGCVEVKKIEAKKKKKKKK